MIETRALSVLVFVAALGLGGCVERPTVRLHHAALRSASFQGVGLDLYIQVDNKNSYDVRIRNVRGQVTVANRYMLLPFAFSPNQWLPAGEKTLVRVPMLIPYAMIPSILTETVASPTITYSVRGSADVTAVRMLGIEKDDYPIDEVSSISRVELIAAAGYSMQR